MTHVVPLVKTLPDGRRAPSVRTGREVDPAALVAALNLPPSSCLLLIAGGAGNLSEKMAARLVNLFTEIGKLVRDHDATVIDGGTCAGVMQLMGQALAQAGAAVTHIGVLPARAEIDDTGLQAEDNLDPNHSYFVLVESNTWGDETDLMYRLAAHLSANIPSIALLINGGNIALHEVEKNVEQGREIIVITGSGRLADEIAAAVYYNKLPTRQRVAEVVRKGKLLFFNLDAPPERLTEILKSRLT